MAITKQDILDYVVYTAYNTNPSVLSSMLDEFATGDNKEEIELSATENKVYTPAEGKVYKKVTVNVPTYTTDFVTVNFEITNQKSIPEVATVIFTGDNQGSIEQKFVSRTIEASNTWTSSISAVSNTDVMFYHNDGNLNNDMQIYVDGAQTDVYDMIDSDNNVKYTYVKATNGLEVTGYISDR